MLNDTISLTLKGLIITEPCARCKGGVYWDGEDNICLQCGAIVQEVIPVAVAQAETRTAEFRGGWNRGLHTPGPGPIFFDESHIKTRSYMAMWRDKNRERCREINRRHRERVKLRRLGLETT